MTHIAIIPDGNRRWAKKRGLPAFVGHEEGARATEKIFKTALDMGVTHLSFWGASINNVTKRSSSEVAFLFKLFAAYFKKLAKNKTIHERGVRIRALGRWADYFSPESQQAIREMVDVTKDYQNYNLTFLLAYNGTEEMVSAVQNIVNDAVAGGVGTGRDLSLPTQKTNTKPTITEQAIKQHLYTKDLPPIDMVIRTGNEPHLSTGFMMWDTADAQLYFSEKMWPEFSPDDFRAAIKNLQNTERRLGK